MINIDKNIMPVFTKKEIKTIKDKGINNAEKFSMMDKEVLFNRFGQ